MSCRMWYTRASIASQQIDARAPGTYREPTEEI
jgi:hypothetical protein